jgi:hypothetical protein
MAKPRRKGKNSFSMRDKVRKGAKMSASQKGSSFFNKEVSLLKIEKKGTKKLDVIPFFLSKAKPELDLKAGDPWFVHEYQVHYNVGPNDEAVVCPKSIGKSCPICKERSRLMKTGEDEELAEALKPKRRALLNVIDLGGDGSVQVFDYPVFSFLDELNKEVDEGDEENAGFADLQGGKTLKARFSEETYAGRKFLKCTRIDFDNREDDYDEEIMEDAVQLDDLLKVKSSKELSALLFDDEEEEEEEERPKRKKGKKTSRRDEDVDDEDEEEDKEEEEEEEERPKKRKTATRKTKTPKCPEGYEFGADFDEHDECDDCPIYRKCGKASDELPF